MKDKIKKVIEVYPVEELALGYLRYETIRLLTPTQYKNLCERNITEDINFDTLVDKLIEDQLNMKYTNIVLNIKFKKLNSDAIIPTRGSPHAAGYDLYAINNVTIGAGTRQLIKLGFSTVIPDGYYGHISDRSGVAWKKGLHTMGKIIDSDYRGEWGVILLNTNTKDLIHLQKGEKIAQVIFHQHQIAAFEEVNELEESVRGEGGYGSTGS